MYNPFCANAVASVLAMSNIDNKSTLGLKCLVRFVALSRCFALGISRKIMIIILPLIVPPESAVGGSSSLARYTYTWLDVGFLCVNLKWL